MARTSTQTARKSTPKAIVARGNKTLAADKPLPGETPLKKMAQPSEVQLINSLTSAEGFHRDALMIELSVGLAFYASKSESNKVDLKMKKGLREIYGKAGYDCLTPQGADYQTVACGTSVTALLFAHIGGYETISDWVADAPASKAVVKIQEALGPRKFDTINSVLAYVGKPVVVKKDKPKKDANKNEGNQQGQEKKEPEVQLTDAERLMAAQLDAQMLERKLAEKAGVPPGRIFNKGPLQLSIPFNASYDDVMALALELMSFAKTQMPLPVDKGAPTAQPIAAMTPAPAAA